MVLARLLTPDDFGLIGMVIAVTGFAEHIKSMGLSTVTIQRRTISQEQLSFLFWVNLALGLGVAVTVASAAPLITAFYSRPELTPVTIALSTSFVFGGLAAQHLALLSRSMRFGSLAVLEVSVISLGTLAAIGAALLGAGYWSLVVLHISQALFRAVIAVAMSRWRPSRPSVPEGAWEMLKFGANLSGFELLNYVARNADNVLIGRYLGAAPLGIYSKAYGLLLLPIQQIQGPAQRVAIPTLSRLQDAPERFRDYFLTGLRAVAFVTIPGLALLAVSAEEIVLIVLGDQWTAAVPVFRTLAIAGLAQALLHSNGWMYVSLGRARRQLAWSVITAPIVVGAIAFGLRWGIEGVATSYAVVIWVLFLPSFWFVTRGTTVSTKDVISCGFKPAVFSSIGAVAALFVQAALPPATPHLVSGVIVGLTFGLGATLTVLVWPGARAQARDLLALLRGSYRSA